MEELIDSLQNSLVYKMSLGSKELYHSNIWAWLINREPKLISAFTNDIPHDLTFLNVTREEKNRDLTLWYGTKNKREKAIVIENKLKAIPTKIQLEKYQSELGNNFYLGVLVGFIKPGFGLPTGWIFISYSKLTENMLQVLENTEDNLPDRDVIKKYLSNNITMEKIVLGNISKDNYKLVFNEKLDWLGLQDLTNKVIASSLEIYVRERLKYNGFNSTYFDIENAFHNKKPTISFRLYNEKAPREEQLYICIQIEAYEYRRFIWLPSHKGDRKELFERYSNDFFDKNFKKGNLISFPGTKEKRKTKMKQDYCGYNNDCVYQYFDIEEGASFEEIYRLINDDLLIMMKIMDKHLSSY